MRRFVSLVLVSGSLSCAATPPQGGLDRSPEVEVQAAPIDDVPEWAESARDLCFLGHADSCVIVAVNRSPEDYRRAKERKGEEDACRREYTDARGVYSGPDTCTNGFVALKDEGVLDEPRSSAQEKRDRARREAEEARESRWYHRALAARLRVCERVEDTATECSHKATKDLAYYNSRPLTAEVRAAFDDEVTRHRAVMRSRCEEGEAKECWAWFRTYEVDEAPNEQRAHELALRALEAGSTEAWELVLDLLDVDRQGPFADLTRDERRGALTSAPFGGGSFGGAFSENESPPVTRKESAVARACRKGDMLSCYIDSGLGRNVTGNVSAPMMRRAEELRARSWEHCGSSGKADSCWVAGYVAHRKMGDEDLAREAYARGCELGSSRSCYGLGTMLARRGEEDAAPPYLSRSCDLGHRAGCTLSAIQLTTGHGIAKDVDRARAYLNEVCGPKVDDSEMKTTACRTLAYIDSKSSATPKP